MIGDKLGHFMKRKNSEKSWEQYDDESQNWRQNYRNKKEEVEETEDSGKVVRKV